MNELKLRWFRKRTKEMVYNLTTTIFPDGSFGTDEDSEHTIFGGQITTIPERNGRSIYAGDIVRFHYFYQSLGGGLGVTECEHELIGIVEWGLFGWHIRSISGQHWAGYTGFEDGEGESSVLELCAMNESAVHEESFEVIGNIYENPELIPKK